MWSLTLQAIHDMKEPKLTTTWGAGFSFSKCHAETAVPYDPYLEQVKPPGCRRERTVLGGRVGSWIPGGLELGDGSRKGVYRRHGRVDAVHHHLLLESRQVGRVLTPSLQGRALQCLHPAVGAEVCVACREQQRPPPPVEVVSLLAREMSRGGG